VLTDRKAAIRSTEQYIC